MKILIKQFSSFVAQHRAECICFALFSVLALIGFIKHEPSYDEAQAWQIARTAPVADMVWGTIPVYEGHPPFWHLLLSVPAKLGITWHTATSILGMLLMLANGFLLFFKSPFPRWVRCLLPFNYFLFYQYGIIVRPYGFMVLLVLLAAMYFKQKDQRPGLFVGLLAALCACHLFGIAIAGGITLAWLWDIKASRPWKEFLLALRTDKRFYWMLGLLGWTVLILALIIVPRAGAAIRSAAPPVSMVRQMVYVFLAMPAEAVLTDFDSSFHTTRRLLPWAGLISTAGVGLVLWVFTLGCTPRKNWLYLLLPYACVGVILTGYSSCHHVGVIFVLFIGYFWLNLAQHAVIAPGPEPVNLLAKALLGLALVVPAGWAANTLYWDYKLTIYPAQEMVHFLKKYNLTNQTIFTAWVMKPTQNNNYSTNTNAQPSAVLLNMYLDHNIFANFHDGQNKGYIDNFCPPYEDMVKVMNQWRLKEVPTVLINNVPMNQLYNNPTILDNYRIAYVGKEYQLWKLNPPKANPQTIHIFSTLWEKYKDQILADAMQAG